MSPSNQPARPDRPASRRDAGVFLLLAVAVWVVGFQVFFYTRTLPNAPAGPDGKRPSRTDVWSIVPGHLLDVAVTTLAPPNTNDAEVSAGWQFLPQRFPLWTAAAFLLLTCWSCGRLILRYSGCAAALTRCERLVLSLAVGLGCVSLFALLTGWLGWLHRLWVVGVLLMPILLEAVIRWLAPVSPQQVQPPGEERLTPEQQRRRRLLRTVCVMSALPFVVVIVLGGASPSTDFDVKEYHLQGPKEWYQQGQMTFLRHNVYTSFPFLTEMISLLGMVVYGDWFWGALVGKSVLCWLGPATAVACYALTRRWFGETAGLIAGFVYLTTPWTVRISIIAYAEGGLCFYVLTTWLAVMLLITQQKAATDASHLHSDATGTSLLTRQAQPGTLFYSSRWIWVCGFLAGSAMACKYTGAVFVVVPVFVGLLGLLDGYAQRQQLPLHGRFVAHRCGAYACGVGAAIGPWLFRNLLWTGNPVYPLLGSIFGGVDWNATRNEQWAAAHSPSDRNVLGWFVLPQGRPGWLVDISAINDWLSPLLYGLAVLGVLRFLLLTEKSKAARAAGWQQHKELPLLSEKPRRVAGSTFAFWVFLYIAWWMLTHRLDRFWVPLLPVVAVFAGMGAVWSKHRGWRGLLVGSLVTAWLFNLTFVTTGLVGYNAFASDLKQARVRVARITNPAIAELNRLALSDRLPAEAKVLLVGEASPFDARFPVVYNTVFDDSVFLELTSVPQTTATLTEGGNPQALPSARLPIDNSAADKNRIQQRLHRAGITHVLVNWGQILRYRLPGSYGYADRVHPDRLKELVRLGVLQPPQVLSQRSFKSLSESERKTIEESGWRAELVHGLPTAENSGLDQSPSIGEAVFLTDLLYRVNPPVQNTTTNRR